MIIHKTIEEDESGKLIECIINSSNILKTSYFAHRNRLFVYFNRGHVYSYDNITEDIYEKFEEAESQGEFLRREIMKNPRSFPFHKEFKLGDSEIKEAKQILLEWKNNQA